MKHNPQSLPGRLRKQTADWSHLGEQNLYGMARGDQMANMKIGWLVAGALAVVAVVVALLIYARY
ncbi:MAG: hypothetical protein ACYSTO_11755, partial [Planctomycetota bacterium]